MKKIYMFVLCSVFSSAAIAANVTARAPAVINTTGTIAGKVTSSSLYTPECYESYFSCMDGLCMSDNADGGRCMCSDENAAYETSMTDAENVLNEANRLRNVEVEKIQAGANADIVFAGTRKYDDKGNVIEQTEITKEQEKANKRASLLALFEDKDSTENVFGNSISTIADLSGNALYAQSHDLCAAQMPASCAGEKNLLTQLYSAQIKSDCKAFDLTVKNLKRKAESELASAQKEVRTARLASFESANKYDRGTCMVEFRKCMMGSDACGSDWSQCVGTIAFENMQNSQAKSVANTKVATISTYNITDSTMEMLDAKRNICEGVLNQCTAVRDNVWPDFLREVAMELKAAELKAESNQRQSCLSNISNCIQKACRDDIVGKGVDTMDSCLSRPQMARSFCKVEIDPCERMEPLIWDYVTDKLAAMRVDRCTQEVKDCFTADDRCGANFENCIGMDYDYMHDMCPLDKLVVCKQGNPDFSMSDIDRMLMGFYLNVDNAALENCQNLVNAKMLEVCGSTTDCNKFAADDVIGTGSLAAQKLGATYRVTGMISFGSIKMGNGVDRNCAGLTTRQCESQEPLEYGKINVDDYIASASAKNENVPNREVILESVDNELKNIEGTINRVVELIEKDQQIQYCISGRDLSQITGNAGDATTARFPNLLNQVKMQISMAALRKAQDNYNEKLTKEITKASSSASVDMANLMCNRLPYLNGASNGVSTDSFATTLNPPYAISMEFGGVSDEELARELGKSGSSLGGFSVDTQSGKNSKEASVIASIGTLGVSTMIEAGAKSQNRITTDGGYKDMWSVFNRETGVCHYCTSTVTKSCKTKGSRGFLGLWDSRGVDCKTSAPVEECEDIQMGVGTSKAITSE